MDKEFLQYINETGYDDLLEINKEDISRYKNTLCYRKWIMENAYKEFAKAMRETKLGSVIIWVVEFLDRCFNKFFLLR